MNTSKIKQYWPELLLILIGLFFIFRELGTFPDAWEDDSLFMIVAKNLAEGRGYTLPVYTFNWQYSYLLGVGPAAILPSALFVKLFGFSIAIARIPMTLYLIGTSIVMYLFTKRISTLWNARWATALLLSFSAFMNTGKPVLGEIPAFFFLMLTFYLLTFRKTHDNKARSTIAAGILIGLSVMTKVTYGIIFPALALAWLTVLSRKDWKELSHMTAIGGLALLTYAPWRIIESMHGGGFIAELKQYAFAEGGTDIFHVLRETPELLLRFQYVYFATLLFVGLIGLWYSTRKMSQTLFVIILSFILLFVAYFLNGPGWYRHLLPAHLLLIPFVPIGIKQIVQSKTITTLLLLFFVCAQGWWQLTYHGSRKSDEALIASEVFAEQYADETMIIRHPEIYVRLPYKENWYFLSGEFSLRTYALLDELPLREEEHCLPVLRRIPNDQIDQFDGRITELHKRYKIVAPPEDC